MARELAVSPRWAAKLLRLDDDDVDPLPEPIDAAPDHEDVPVGIGSLEPGCT
jgi:hypothetical protein